jgi:arginine decarboxylase
MARGQAFERARRGDTADVMLDYVGYDLASLRGIYADTIAAAKLPADEAARFGAALVAGLPAYTDLSDEPLG